MLARERRITGAAEGIARALAALAEQFSPVQLPSLAPRRPPRPASVVRARPATDESAAMAGLATSLLVSRAVALLLPAA
jgi:hypothetical protein